ncbi:MAG: tol-pal system YbgF family protein [Mariniblastus sp.]
MKAIRMFALGSFTAAMMLTVSLANAATDGHNHEVVASFLKHVESLDSISDKIKAEVKESVEELSKEQSPDAVTEGLIKVYPEYLKAVESSDADNIDEAVKLLGPLAESEDKFLAAEASFYLARTLMNGDRFEDAISSLDKVTGDMGKFTVHQGSAQYFTGVANAGLLNNAKAIESFMQFLQFNPDAPERLRVSAWRQVQQLQSIQEGKLDDVHQRMDYSRRRLDLNETGEKTQTEQDKIVTMLTKMIKEEEKKECSSNCKKGGT